MLDIPERQQASPSSWLTVLLPQARGERECGLDQLHATQHCDPERGQVTSLILCNSHK